MTQRSGTPEPCPPGDLNTVKKEETQVTLTKLDCTNNAKIATDATEREEKDAYSIWGT